MSCLERFQELHETLHSSGDLPSAQAAFYDNCLHCGEEPNIVSRFSKNTLSDNLSEYIAECQCRCGEPSVSYQTAIVSWQNTTPVYAAPHPKTKSLLMATLASVLLAVLSTPVYAEAGFAAQGGDIPFAVNLNAKVGDWSATALSVYGELDSVMTNTGNMRMLGQLPPAGVGSFFRNDGSNTYLLLTNAGDSLGGWNNMRPLIVNDTSGAILLDAGGNQGHVGINTITPQAELDVNGDAQLSGSVTALYYAHTSDARLKSNVAQIPDALAKVVRLRGVTFVWKKNARPDMGVIAQEVGQVFPNIVHTNKQGIKSVEYDSLIAPLIEAVKELKADNDRLHTEVKALKTSVASSERGNKDE